SPMDQNVFSGLLTAYFVVTALTTVRPPSPGTRRLDVTLLAVAVGVALVDFARGVKAWNSPRHVLEGVPFPMFFIVGGVLALRAAGAGRVLPSGSLRGSRRLFRHLWRMCLSLFMAGGSFFPSRRRVGKILPEPFTAAPMRALPILLVLGAMLY